MKAILTSSPFRGEDLEPALGEAERMRVNSSNSVTVFSENDRNIQRNADGLVEFR